MNCLGSSYPRGSKGNAQLVFASVLTDQKGQVDPSVKAERGGESSGEFLFTRRAFHASTDPVLFGSEFLEPGEGCGQQKLPTWFHERRESPEKGLWLRKPADQIRRQDDIVGPQTVWQSHGILNGKSDPGTIDLRRDPCRERTDRFTLDREDRVMHAFRGKPVGGRDEGVGKITGHHGAAGPGQFER